MNKRLLQTPDELCEAINSGKTVFSYNGDVYRKSKLPAGGFILDSEDVFYIVDRIEFEKDVYYTLEKD